MSGQSRHSISSSICPFEVLLSFIDEVLRVLKPGGVALFETPNPDNVLVGSATFYLDPTHQRPLPSGLLKISDAIARVLVDRGAATTSVSSRLSSG